MSTSQIVFNARKVAHKKRGLSFRSALGSAAEQNDGGLGFLPQRQEHTEVSVRRHQHPTLMGSKLHQVLVVGLVEPKLAHVRRVIPSGVEHQVIQVNISKIE